MKNHTLIRLFPLFILLSLFFFQCERPANEAVGLESANDVPADIQAYTTGVIGRKEAVYVQFTNAPQGEVASLIRISPAVEGEAKLRGTGLSFTPTSGWASGTNYTAKVKTAGGEDFSFTFSTPERRAEVVSDGLYIPDGGEARLTGRVVTNDAATAAEIAGMLSAKQGGKAIDVEVAAGTDDRHFSYTIAVPDRSKAPAPVTIAYDGGKSGFAHSKGELSVVIPAADDFRVESMVVSEEEDGALLVRFSAALQAGQDLNGMIRFPGNTSYTTRINGNLLYIYPKSDNLGQVTIRLADGIKNKAGLRLGRETNWTVNLGQTEPALRVVGNGNILPHEGKRLYPFEAVGLEAVRLEIVKIYADNVSRYLQDNSLASRGDDWSMRYVGKIITQERVELSSLSDAVNPARWSRYALDLSQYIGDDAAAVYQIRLGFGMEDALAGCDVGPEDFGLSPLATTGDADDFVLGFQEQQTGLGDYYGIHGHYNDFNWRDQDKPCTPAYYNRDRFISQNLLSSNLGRDRETPSSSTSYWKTNSNACQTITPSNSPSPMPRVG